MQEQELVRLVDWLLKHKCETQHLEVKKAEGGAPEKLYDTLSSFSNQDEGGIILFGFDEKNNFEQVKLYNPQAIITAIDEQCKQMTPKVRPQITVKEVNGNMVLAAEIPGVDISERPVFYNGKGKVRGSYIRVGQADEQMTDSEIYAYKAFRKKVQDDLRFIEGKTLNDLSQIKLQKFLLLVKEGKPRLAELKDSEILELLGITKNGVPTLAGFLTLGKYPQSVFPRLCLTAVVVPGTEYGDTGAAGERFVANKRIEGTIDEMLEEARIFVARNMRVKTIIDKSGDRTDKDEYPMKAVREAILNALMHRDLSSNNEGVPVQIRMFYDRIEIISPGGLYGKVSISNLGKIMPDSRNKTLATILEIMGIAENRYSGVPTIKRECEIYKLPMPEFKSQRGEFTVTIYNGQSMFGIGISTVEKILEFCKVPRLRKELVELLGITQYYLMKTYIEPLVNEGKLKLTLPNVPKSKNNRYYTSG